MNIRFQIEAGEPYWVGTKARALLMALIECNLIWLSAEGDAPPLYDAGVRYKKEWREDWKDIPHILKDGHGDCEDLVAWRCAELILAGEFAEPSLLVYPVAPGRTYFHVVVNRGATVEDPSAELGMEGAF